MIRLDLSTGPRWIDLVSGVRLEVLPLRSSLLQDLRADLRDDFGEDVPDTASGRARQFDALCRLAARRVIVGWEGVGDADGAPADVTEENIAALMEHEPAFVAFRQVVVVPALTVVDEGNG